jgi:hypothetical protein
MHKTDGYEEEIILTDEVIVFEELPPVIKNKIIGKRTINDKQYCEKVDPLDLHSTVEIRKYIKAVETFLNEKENSRSVYESQSRLLKYIFFFGLGATTMFSIYSLFVGNTNF